MPTIRENVFTITTGDVTVSGLIGTRCYPTRLPDDVSLPAISWSIVSDADGVYQSHDTGPTPRSFFRVSFNCWAESSDDAGDLADALIDLWSGQQNCPDVGSAQIVGRYELYEPTLGRYRTVIDFIIDHAR